MRTREDDIDVHALPRQGWTISAIARHLGRDRKTIRGYLAGERQAGVRATSWADPFDPFAAYCAQRLKDDPHLWASALFDELLELGYYARPDRQDRRGEPLPHTGIGVGAVVIDPGCFHRDRARSGGDLPLLVRPVAHHQAVPVLVTDIGELFEVSGDLDLQRGREL